MKLETLRKYYRCSIRSNAEVAYSRPLRQHARAAPTVANDKGAEMHCLNLLSVACILLALSVSVVRSEEQAEDVKSAAAQWIAERQEAFKSYTFQLGDNEERLELESRSILNWSNPERSAAKGGVFLWTYNGRPQLVACAFMNRDKVEHEFQSLASLPIVAERDSRQVHRFEPGIEWTLLKDAPSPAKKPALRLSQFRRQAERFDISFGEKEKWTQTRMLTQPVFLSENHGVALFLFVQGTDPECTLLLMIEDEKIWHFALARQTTYGVKAKLDEEVVWERMPAWLTNPGTSFVVLRE
jgi:hypothetical protein